MTTLIPTTPVHDPAGEEVDLHELLCGHVVDNDPQQRFATSFGRGLLTSPPGIVQQSNVLLVGPEGSGISTILEEMLAGRIPGANLAGPSVMRVRLAGNQSTTQILRSIAIAEENRLNVATTNVPSGRLQADIVEGLTTRQIRVLVFFNGDLAVTMKKATAQEAMTVLNALLGQANCCAIIHTSPAAVGRFSEGEIGQRIFRQLRMSGFGTVAEVERYGRNWDGSLAGNRWGGLPWGGLIGTKAIARLLFDRTKRTLADVTDLIKGGIIVATEAKEEIAPKHFEEALRRR